MKETATLTKTEKSEKKARTLTKIEKGEKKEDDTDEDREERGESESAEDFESDEGEQDEPVDSMPETETEADTADGLRIQAIGDSHLAFNGAMSTANQLGQILNERGVPTVLENNAIGGATLGCGERGIGTGDNCIPPQYQDGQWSHVVISAGGNDFLESQCRNRCERTDHAKS